MFCGDLRWVEWGHRVGRRSKREGIYVYIQLIYFVVQQKLTQHCKAIMFQYKINLIAKRKRKKKRTVVPGESLLCKLI